MLALPALDDAIILAVARVLSSTVWRAENNELREKPCPEQ